MQARVDPVPVPLPGLLLVEPVGDLPGFIRHDDSAVVGVAVGMGEQSHHAAPGFMETVKPVHINVKNHVAAQQQEILSQLLLQQVQRTCRTKGFRFHHIRDAYAEGLAGSRGNPAAVAKILPHHMAKMADHQDDIPVALVPQALQLVFQNGLVQDPDHGLRDLRVHGRDPGPFPSGHNNSFHSSISPLGIYSSGV